LNLKNQAWDRLILKYAAKKQRIKTTNKEVIEKIASLPLFQKNGVFEERLYSYIVTNIFRSSPREFEESIRTDIVIEKMVALATKEVTLSEDEIYEAYKAKHELADVSYLFVKSEDYKGKVSIEEKDIINFYQNNKDTFMSPVSVNVDYVQIPFNDDKEEARFVAEELDAEIKKGKSFKDLSKEYGLEIKETGYFSISSKIPSIGLSYPFALAALELTKNQISGIVEITDSFCIMQLKSRREPALLPFEKVKNKAKEMLIVKESENLSEAESNKLIALIKTGAKTFEDIAREHDLAVLNAKGITQKSYIEEIGPSDTFSDTSFSLKINEVGGPAKTQKGYAIIRLDSLTPIDEGKFKTEKEVFAEELLKNKRNSYFQNWFLDLKKSAKFKNNLS